jgi:hypothetical protein
MERGAIMQTATSHSTQSTHGIRFGTQPNSSLLRPQQQKSGIKIRRSTDFRSQRMIKYNGIANFHSLAEFYHAALLEGDPLVQAYVPQPYCLRYGKKTYIPDIYYDREDKRYVGELKPRAEFDKALHEALKNYFQSHGMTFMVIDNESVYGRAMAAQNWLTVVRWLLTYPDLDTEQARLTVLEQVLEAGELPYGQIANLGDRASSLAKECAVHQLLHAGELTADFDEQFFCLDTVLRPC